MHPKLDRRCFLLLISLQLILYIRGSVCQEDGYRTCDSRFNCGGIRNTSYPFWGGDRPEYCGYPGFELDCQDGVPIFKTSPVEYRVIEIDSSRQTLKVARADFWSDICPRFLYDTSTTLRENLFFSSEDRNITLYYSCSTSSGQPLLQLQLPWMFNCNVNDTDIISFFTAGGRLPSLSGPAIINCDTTISVPVNQTAFESLATTTATTSLLQGALVSGFSLRWSANDDACASCIRSGGQCGTNQNPLTFACYCANGTYESTCNNNNTQPANGSKEGLDEKWKYVIGLSLGIPSIVTSVIIIGCYLKRIRSSGNSQQEDNKKVQYQLEHNKKVEEFLVNHGSLSAKLYNYSDIKNITKSFSDKLGQGGYGSVYKGMLPDGRLVAVKVLDKIKGNGEDFMNEVSSISRTSHVNIVNLLGFCYEKNRRALIYEFMPYGSLEKLIYKSGSLNPICHLEWEVLYQIAIGVARGLEYLHKGCNTRIVHFDVKPQNILIDEDFNPKISDFGLAKLCRKKQSIMSTVGTRGTIGYIAPEVFFTSFGGMSYKSDVYSYGMMVLEMAGARKIFEVRRTQSSENYFPDTVYELTVVRETIKLDEVLTCEEEEIARKMFLVGFWCIQTIPLDRPSMTKVLEMLNGSVESIEIPPKPHLFAPRLPTPDFSSSFSVPQETEDHSES